MLSANRLSSALLALFALLLAAATPPPGEELNSSSLQRARSLVREELRYSEAVPLLRQALRDPSIGVEERTLACELLGLAYLAQGDAARADAVLWELYRVAPDHTVAPELSPKVQAAFAEARARAERAPRIEELIAERSEDRVLIRALLSDERAEVAQVLVHLHQADGRQRSIPALIADGRLSAELPDGVWRDLGPRPRCHLTGQDRSGAVIAQLGTLDAPVPLPRPRAQAEPPAPTTAPVDRAQAQPEDESSLLWISAAAGAAVLLGGAAAIALWLVLDPSGSEPDPPGRPTGTLEPIELD